MGKAGLAFIALAVVAIGALLMLATSGDGRYDRSALGMKGLDVWLQSKEVAVARSQASVRRMASELSLRILPLRALRDKPSDRHSRKLLDGELDADVLEEKLHELPTLVILPKWGDAVLKDGIARSGALAATASINAPLRRMDLTGLRVRRLGAQFTDVQIALPASEKLTASLYRAQLFDRRSIPPQCVELAGAPAGALLIRCEDETRFHLLSDPDLLNNHGLAQGRNADAALALIRYLRGSIEVRPVYIDTDAKLLGDSTATDEGRDYERSAGDLARLFDWPLSAIWAVMLVTTLVCLWSGSIRFGPPRRSDGDHIALAKTAAIDATARLLRLSGNDGRMAAQFVQNMLADRAIATLGSGAASQDGVQRLFQHLARRDPSAAEALKSVSTALMTRGPGMSPHDLRHNLHAFTRLMRSLDFGS